MNAEWRRKWIWRPGGFTCLGLVVWHMIAPATWGWLTTGQVWGLLGLLFLFGLITAADKHAEESKS